jgi:23S rRNA pseudouridine1911/1915/1917 synthase
MEKLYNRDSSLTNSIMDDSIEKLVAKREVRFSVAAHEATSRVDEMLAARCGWLSRIGIGRLIADGACLVNGVSAPAGRKLQTGDEVCFTYDENDASNAMTPEALPLEIIYEDAHLLVVIKPTGCLCTRRAT